MPPLGIDRFSIINGDGAHTIDAVTLNCYEHPDPNPWSATETTIAPGETRSFIPSSGTATKVTATIIVGEDGVLLDLDVGPVDLRIERVVVGILDASTGWEAFGWARLSDGSSRALAVV
jgi:hypothetical protein